MSHEVEQSAATFPDVADLSRLNGFSNSLFLNASHFLSPEHFACHAFPLLKENNGVFIWKQVVFKSGVTLFQFYFIWS